MSNKLIFEHSLEPVTLTEAKAHLRVTTADEDALIQQLITDSRTFIERIVGVDMVHKHYDYVVDMFPFHDQMKIELPVSPLDSVEFIKYTDIDEVLQTWDSSLYTVDNANQLGLIYPAIDEVYPNTINYPNAVQVRYQAGPAEEANDTAQSGSATEIVLAAADTNVDDYYNGMLIEITSGKGAGQYTRITDYVSSTKTATVSDSWSPSLDATSVYTIIANTISPLRRAVLLLIGHWYENRENMLTGTIASEISLGVKSLTAPYKVYKSI